MKCQILFSGKNKKNNNLSSAELAMNGVKVNCLLNFLVPFLCDIAYYYYILAQHEKRVIMLYAERKGPDQPVHLQSLRALAVCIILENLTIRVSGHLVCVQQWP